MIPNFTANLPTVLQPIVGSSLVMGTVTALLLNASFRIGQRKRISMTLDPAKIESAKVEEFFVSNGRRWGARTDVVNRAAFGISQGVEVIQECCAPRGPLTVEAKFDEFNLNVEITYRSTPLELPDRRPSEEDILESERGHVWLAGFLLRRNADRVGVDTKGEISVLTFHFEH
jgi:xanthine permease XanP